MCACTFALMSGYEHAYFMHSEYVQPSSSRVVILFVGRSQVVIMFVGRSRVVILFVGRSRVVILFVGRSPSPMRSLGAPRAASPGPLPPALPQALPILRGHFKCPPQS